MSSIPPAARASAQMVVLIVLFASALRKVWSMLVIGRVQIPPEGRRVNTPGDAPSCGVANFRIYRGQDISDRCIKTWATANPKTMLGVVFDW